MELGVLGPLELDGQPAPALGSKKARGFVELLALRAPRPVPIGEIETALWGDEPIPTARKAIQGFVSHVRRLLGQQVLVTMGESYCLKLSRDAVDALRFEDQVDYCRRLLVSGASRAAAERLTQVLRLWRGDPVPELADQVAGTAIVTRLEEVYRTAQEDLAEARLTLGEHESLIHELRDAAEAEPFRERRWSQLMVALYRCGRQADALRAYQQLRTLLGEELGIEPGPSLAALEESILLNKEELNWRPPQQDEGDQLPWVEREFEQIPLSHRLGHAPSIGVIGRVKQRLMLERTFDRIAAGDGRQVVLITGEPGQGKTTLVGQLARYAWNSGATVVLGRCDDDFSSPYRPFAEIIDHLVGDGDEERVLSLMGERANELTPIVPNQRPILGDPPAPRSSDPETNRYQLFAAVEALVISLARRSPLVLIIEDLHWADSGTLQMLRYLVSNVEAPLLIVGTYRHTDTPHSASFSSFSTFMQREPDVTRVDLQGLDFGEVQSFIEATTGNELVHEDELRFAAELHRETGGNPFFVGELVRNLDSSAGFRRDESGTLAGGDGPSSIALPETIRELISDRVDRLGADATRIFGVASVIGREFDVDTLERVAETETSDVLDLLEAGAKAALVEETSEVPGSFRFSHALIQRALYLQISRTRRSLIHQTVANAIEAQSQDHKRETVTKLAYHWAQSRDPQDLPKAFRYTYEAAEAAMEARAPTDAVGYYATALDLFAKMADADPRQRVHLLLALGDAQRQSGNAEFRETLLEAAHSAQRLGAIEELIDAALLNNRGYFSAVGSVDSEKVEVLEAALDALPEGDSTQRALLLARLCAELSWAPTEQRRSIATDAIAIGRRGNDPLTLFRVLFWTLLPLEAPSMTAQLLQSADELMALATTLEDPDCQYWANAVSHRLARQVGDLDRATSCLAQMKRLAVGLRQPGLRWSTMFVEASAALAEGDPRHAESCATEALALGIETGQPDAESFYGSQLAVARFQQGRLGEYVEMVEEVVERNPTIEALQAVLASALIEADRLSDATWLLERAASNSFGSLAPDLAWTAGITNYARVAIELGAKGPAEQLFQLLEPFHKLVPANGVTAHEPVAHFLGGLASTIGEPAVADRYFREAAVINAKGGMRFADAQTSLLWGRSLLARGASRDATAARKLLEQARERSARFGYRGIEARATEAIAQMVQARQRRQR